MYTLAVKRDFIAQHYLVGGDWGVENKRHSHHYLFELHLEGKGLDEHGFLVDIVMVEEALDGLIDGFRERTLNELPSFAGLNPSIEHFSRILCQALAKKIRAKNIETITVRIWENENAWASYSQPLNEASAL